MIGRLNGTIIQLDVPTVLIEVAGVAYEVDVPLPTFCQLELNQTVCLWTHLVVREDAQQLYGFIEANDKHLFRILLKVNGVGPKMALAILSTLSGHLLIQTIEHEDLNTLTKVPGVGKKTAERLLIELRDRFKILQHSTPSATLNPMDITPAIINPIADAEAALISLGYKPLEAQKAVAAVKADFENSADMIRAALKSMMKK